MHEKVLIVDPDTAEQQAVAALLTASGYRTMVASTVAEARERLQSTSADVMLTVVHRGGFNGLVLLADMRATASRLAVVAVHDVADGCSELMSEPAGPIAAVHITRPVDHSALRRVVAEALSRRERRRWSRTLLAAPMSIRAAHGRPRVIDVSYDGLQLEFPSEWAAQSESHQLELPHVGVSVAAHRVWTRPSDRGDAVRSGMRIAQVNLRNTLRWRRLVDMLRTAGSQPPMRGGESR